jgi:hypothetical protein
MNQYSSSASSVEFRAHKFVQYLICTAFLQQQIGEAETAKKESKADVDFLSSIEVSDKP